MNEKPDMAGKDLRQMAVDIIEAFIGHNPVSAEEVPKLIRAVYSALRDLERPQAAGAEEAPQPAVNVRRSVTRDHLVCLECGRKLKTLKRHLQTAHGISPADYRAKWDLPDNYPLVAPNYAARRSTLAKDMGLGRKPRGNGRRKGARKSSGVEESVRAV